MKLCISATASGLDAQVDPRFGRCQYLTFVDTDTMACESIENPNITASGGAGIQAAQLAAGKGVAAVLTGNLGPNAYNALQAAGITMITGVSGTVRDVVAAWNNGELKSTTSGRTAASHAGMGGMPQSGDQNAPLSGGFGTGRGMGMGGGRGMGCGRGMGGSRGMGGGRGMGGIISPPEPFSSALAATKPSSSKEQELDALKKQSEALEAQLASLRERIHSLEKA